LAGNSKAATTHAIKFPILRDPLAKSTFKDEDGGNQTQHLMTTLLLAFRGKSLPGTLGGRR
jgi:hypothetical protein